MRLVLKFGFFMEKVWKIFPNFIPLHSDRFIYLFEERTRERGELKTHLQSVKVSNHCKYRLFFPYAPSKIQILTFKDGNSTRKKGNTGHAEEHADEQRNNLPA